MGRFTDWIFANKFVKMMGVNDKFTAFVEVKGKDYSYCGPIESFSNSIISAIKQNHRAFPAEWEFWVKGDKSGRNKKIPAIETWAFIQGALFESGGKVFMNANRTAPEPLHPVVLCLPKSARRQIEETCNAQVPGYSGSPEDYNSRFVCGDFISCAKGKLMTFISNTGDNNTRPHYTLELSPVAVPLTLELVQQEWKPWDKLLKILTEDEQIGVLISHFPPPVLDYAFKGTIWYNLLPPSIHGSFDAMQKAGQQPMQGFVQPGYLQPALLPVAQPQYPVSQQGNAQAVTSQVMAPQGQSVQVPMVPRPPVVDVPSAGVNWGQPSVAMAQAAPMPSTNINWGNSPTSAPAVVSTPAPPPPNFDVKVPPTPPSMAAAAVGPVAYTGQPTGDASQAQRNMVEAQRRLNEAMEAVRQAGIKGV
jgi:hypothetical protein